MQSIITLSIIVAMSTSVLVLLYKQKDKKYIKNIRNTSMLGSIFGGAVGILINQSFDICSIISDMLTGILFAEQVRTLDKSRLTECIGRVDGETMNEIDQAIKISMGVK